MADVLHGICSYPGVVAVESAQITISHGISPGICILRCQPQETLPADFGDLVFADGEGTVTIPGCRLNGIKVDRDDSGEVWSLEIADRRWRWKELGAMWGWYNQLDPHGKLIPWTIRAPAQLAILCLQQMKEVGFTLNLPPGLLSPGPTQTLPQPNVSGVNPPIDWKGIPPAQALQQVAELFGCRVIYRLQSDTILVTPVGIGAALPDEGVSIHKQGPSLKSPQAPDAVAVAGAPTRYQMRLALEPVGEDWDGWIRPIDQLSYAPQVDGTGAAQSVRFTVRYTNPGEPAEFQPQYNISLGDPAAGGRAWQIQATGAGTTASSIAAALAAAINRTFAPAGTQASVSAATGVAPDTANQITVSGSPVGAAFDYTSQMSGLRYPGCTITAELLQQARSPAPGWQNCAVPSFPGSLNSNQVQISRITVLWASAFRGLVYQVTVANAAGGPTVASVNSNIIVVPGGVAVPGRSDALLATALATALRTALGATMTVTVASNVITLTSTTPAASFTVTPQVLNGAVPWDPTPSVGIPHADLANMTTALVQAAGVSFGVRATDRLTLQQARRLAQKSVWRMYRIKNVDASGEGAITVPGYGQILRREQLLLQGTQVDQVTPTPPDPRTANLLGEEQFQRDYYNAYSRDKKAGVYGAAFQLSGAPFIYPAAAGGRFSENTRSTDEVLTPFTIDPIKQLVIFSSPVYFWGGLRGYLKPTLTLQTAVLVRDEHTNALVRFGHTVPLAGGRVSPTDASGTKVQVCNDVQLEVTSRYDPVHNTITDVGVLDRDPLVRANYYLKGLASQYHLSAGQVLEYNGIVPVELDGAIQQVTWSVGPGGASTTASRNTEHHLYVPPYAARRRAEFLPAAPGPAGPILSSGLIPF